MASITLEFGPDGTVKAEADGFRGKGCQRLIDRVAAAMGADPGQLDHQWKPEAEESVQENVSGG